MLSLTPSLNTPMSANSALRSRKVTFTGKRHYKSKINSNGHVTIKNYHHIDDLISRGGKPTEAQISELKMHGYKHIISFCTNYDPKTGTYKGLPEEAKWAKKQEIQFHWLPFHSNENPPQRYIKEFFDITDKARLNGERVFIHCRHGADRTGMFSAMYKIRNYNTSLENVIKEMFKYGHDANGNPNLIPFILKFKEQQGFNLKAIMINLISQIKKSLRIK